MPEIKVLIPSKLSIEELILKNPISFKPYKKDHLAYIISLLYHIQATNPELQLKNGYWPINAEILQDVVGNYNKYLDYLVGKVFETNNWFNVQKHQSRGYRFTRQFLYDKGIVFTITDWTTIKAIKRQEQKIRNRQSYNHLEKWFNTKLRIDAVIANEFIETELERILNDKDLYKKMEQKKKNIFTQYNSAKLHISRIATNDYKPSVDRRVFRFHSPITNLRGTIRNCLTYGNKKLVAVDIKNSQPYFSVILFNTEFWGVSTPHNPYDKGNLRLLKISKNLYKELKPRIREYILTLTLQESAESQYSIALQLYIESVRDGTLYKDLTDALNFPDYSKSLKNINAERYRTKRKEPTKRIRKVADKQRIISEKETKKNFLVILNGNNKYFTDTKLIFEGGWPIVARLFNRIKKEDHSTLGIILQQIESYLVLKIVCKRIAKEKPNLPIFTIHDSVVTTVGHEGYVEKVIIEELENAIGIPPTCKREYWGPENLKFSDDTPFLH